MKKLKYPNNLLSIDGGLNIGLAAWNGTPDPVTLELSLPAKMKSASRCERIGYLMERFDYILDKQQDWFPSFDKAVIEDVRLWWGKDLYTFDKRFGQCFLVPVKSRFSASIIAARKGHTFFTAYIVGGLITKLTERKIEVETITTQEWKGNKSKEDITDKIKDLTGFYYDSEHVTDAVGIGLAYSGLLNVANKKAI